MTSRGMLPALLAAALVFVAAAGLLAVATPYLAMLMTGCFSFHDSCADSAGWVVLLSAPVSLAVIAFVAGGCAVATYLRVRRVGGAR